MPRWLARWGWRRTSGAPRNPSPPTTLPMTARIALGDTVRDTITNFKGVVIADTLWLHGCRRLTVQPQELHEGKPVDALSFDEPQLLLIRPAKIEHTPDETGGPRPEPRRT